MIDTPERAPVKPLFIFVVMFDARCSCAQNITTEIKSGLTEALSGVPITPFLYCSAARRVLGCACPVVIPLFFF